MSYLQQGRELGLLLDEPRVWLELEVWGGRPELVGGGAGVGAKVWGTQTLDLEDDHAKGMDLAVPRTYGKEAKYQ